MEQMGNLSVYDRLEYLKRFMIDTPYYIQENDFFERQFSRKPHYFSIKNLIIPAKVDTNKILLTAHYDVVKASKGYNDNLSGVFALLLLIGRLPDNVEVVFCDKEECGYLGSSYYASTNADKIKLNINVDIVGIPNTIYYTKYDVYSNIHQETYGILHDTYDFYEMSGSNKFKAKSLKYKQIPEKSVILPNTEKVVEINSLPFNDSEAFINYEIPSVILMSAPVLTHPNQFLSEVFKYQHNNILDNQLDLISEDNIEKISEYILEVIKVN